MLRGLISRAAVTIAALMIMAAPAAAQQRDLTETKHERPSALVPLYVAFAGLQAIDAHSTFAALDSGARESNPVMRTALRTPAGLFLLKSGTAAGVVLITEKLWHHNRAAAVISMIALNSAYATIAAHNYRAAGRP